MQVEWAHQCEAPGFVRKGRARGSKALGLSYERKLAKVLPKGSLHGQWFCYSASGQVKFCQTDFLLLGRSELAVLEAKLANVEEAREQLENLYVPVLSVCFRPRRVLPVIVAKSLTRLPETSGEVCARLIQALDVARGGGPPPVLHWIGTGRI